jgi:hypothetical protein
MSGMGAAHGKSVLGDANSECFLARTPGIQVAGGFEDQACL